MSVVKAEDVSHVRFRIPDLDLMRRFLLDFGLIEAEATPERLFMRGYGAAPFIHVAERGEPGFIGFGLSVGSYEDLELLAAHDDVKILDIDGPGGGNCVQLTDPDGFIVEVVYGQHPVEPVPTPAPLPWNESGTQRRLSHFRRARKGMSHVQRLGHVVLSVSDFVTSEAWYKERFGLVTSDEIQPEPGVRAGAFLRCDRGEVTCDHHTVFLFQRPGGPGFIHSAFEVVDLDDLMAGHDHLVEKGYPHLWGVGRHLLGSQIFDYWLDPWGHEIEHWTDGDQLATADGGGIGSMADLNSVQWGMTIPPSMLGPPS